jgi:hypothetical protein
VHERVWLSVASDPSQVRALLLPWSATMHRSSRHRQQHVHRHHGRPVLCRRPQRRLIADDRWVAGPPPCDAPCLNSIVVAPTPTPSTAMDPLHAVLPDASAAAPLAAAGADARLAAPHTAGLSSPSATAVTGAASARAAVLITSGLGLPGYPACTGVLTGLLSLTRLPRLPPPGFSTTRPLVVDATWASPPPTDSTLASTIAAIQAALAASQERERVASRALEQEHALATTLTTQMATAQRLVIGPPLVDQETPSPTPEAPHASALDADHIVALHAQAAGLQNIRSLVSIVLDPASSHYPRWRGHVLLTLRCYSLDDHILDDVATPPSRA